MTQPRSNDSLSTYDLMIPSALAKRASEAMASAGLSKHNTKAMIFLADLVRRSTVKKENKDWIGKQPIKPKFVPVSSRIAQRSFNRSADYTAMVRALIAGGVIEVGRNYAAGSHCRHYRPSADLVNSHCEIQTVSGRQAASSVRAASQIESLKPLRCPLAVFEHQVATLRRLSVSGAAQAMLDRETREANAKGRAIDVRHQYALNRLGRMHKSEAVPDRLLIKEDKNGRMYSPVTNLAGCFKQYLTLDGEQLVSLDITACQPFLLAVLLNKLVDALDTAQWVGDIEVLSDAHEAMADRLGMEEGASRLFWTYLQKRHGRWSPEESTRTKAELSRFMDVVCSGKLYEEIMAQTGYKGDRNSFKTMFFKALYARFRNAMKTQEWRCFAKMFPRVAREMKLMKYAPRDTDWLKASKAYKPTALLPCILQAIEARYWFHSVCPALSKKGIDFITVHDCVLVKSSQSEVALEVMKSSFAQWKLYPAIKVETLETTDVPKSQPLADSRKIASRKRVA